VYTIEERDAVRDRILEMAKADPRVVAAAVVGSLSVGAGDRWSDLDLTFAVRDDVPVDQVLADWTGRIVADLDAVFLFDLPSGDTIYRVFLLPGCLQVDVSFTPAGRFRPRGPRFRLLFGNAGEATLPVPPDPGDLFGWAVAYAREARACIARERWWQAEHSITAIRNHALMLACRRRDLPTSFGRGYDDLPADVLGRSERSLVTSLTSEALLEALRASIDGLLGESAEVGEVAETVGQRLRELLT
jgi:predicted nucleotidyltransferase